jgi:hypothetical protein
MSSVYPSLPAELEPQDDVSFALESRRDVPVRRYRVQFNASPEKRSISLDRAYSAKQLVLLDKQPVFAEFALLALFKATGWQGVWVDTIHRKYFDRMPNESKGISLPPFVNQLVTRVAANNRRAKSRCWDILLWANKTVVFVAVSGLIASEQPGETQSGWIEAALRSGLSADQFIIVEWDYRRVIVRKKRSP